MYAYVNIIWNAWVSGNKNELFRSRLSVFFCLEILETQISETEKKKIENRSDNQQVL